MSDGHGQWQTGPGQGGVSFPLFAFVLCWESFLFFLRFLGKLAYFYSSQILSDV